MSRMLVIGLDCAPPNLVFDRYASDMPFVTEMRRRGTWGNLGSSRPPITVPAWTCMVSGRDPGELGLYGFRLREDDGYDFRVASSNDVRVKRVWDWLGEQGKTVAPLFVPLTSPPSPVRGQMVSGCLWPGPGESWCFPPSLEKELEKRFGSYIGDVPDFRTDNVAGVLDALEAMAAQHFDMADYIWRTKKPDFMMAVEIGVDRLHHVAWQHMDPAHPAYVAGNPHEKRARSFYATLDKRIAALAQDDDINVMVVSDHGARTMERGFCVNQWLVEQGLLHLNVPMESITPATPASIDWARTKAWSTGGYYARVFLNIAGREPHGIVKRSEAPALRSQVVDGLKSLADTVDDFEVAIDTPHDIYRAARGRPPDLMLYFDNLRTRAIGSVGHPALFVRHNDSGPDTCNHDWNGVFVAAGPAVKPRGRIQGATLYDVAPTILSMMQVESPTGILGVDLSN